MDEPLQHLKDFLSGCISGWVQVIVMQPFEIIKVRLINQSLRQPEYRGIIDCFKKIHNQQGIFAFYKGTLMPLLGVGAQVSLQFGSNQMVKKILMKMNDISDSKDEVIPMNLIALAGLLTGIPSSIVVTPVDHTRILLQMQKGSDHTYHGSVDAGIQIFKMHGVRGLYLGYNVTLLREVIAMTVYFTTYEYLMRLMLPKEEQTPSAFIIASFISGGISGSSSWFFTYPIDYVKTRIQSEKLKNRKYTSSWHCASINYHEQGIRSFFKGLGITMLRSFPVSGIGFLAFEHSMRIFNRKD